MVAYVADNRLWIRDLDQTEPREIPDSEGAGNLFWSPRSDELGYVVNNELRKVAAAGGPSLTLYTASGIIGDATWRPDRMIIQGMVQVLLAVSSQGGGPEVYLEADSTRGEQSLSDPHVLPDGQTLIFVVGNQDDSSDLVVQDRSVAGRLVRDDCGRDNRGADHHGCLHRLDGLCCRSGS